MVSTTGTRPTHYDMLGVAPDATAEEIAKAFAREIGMFRVRPVGGLAEVGVAYETLRDPAKRRAYDVAMGFVAEPPKEPAMPDWAPFLMRASAHPVEKRGIDPLHRPARAPQPEPQVRAGRAEPPVDPRLAAIAASVRELAKPVAAAQPAPAPNPEPLPSPKPEPLPSPHPHPKIEPGLGAEQSVPRVHLELADDLEAGWFEWKRPALIGGGLVAAVALIGAWAGVKAGNDAQAQTLESRVTAALPKPKAVAPVEADSLTFAEASPTRRTRTATVHRQRPTTPRALSPQELEELAPVEVGQKTDQGAEATAAPAVAEAAPAPVTQAKMPLPNSVIARTIGRIGYPCGRVASTAEAGAPGVFTVTCTSGHSYRAAPVRGRYHFSRLSSR